jgi:hypothetical protein
LGHAEFTAFQQKATKTFADWSSKARSKLVEFDKGGHPKALIENVAEELLAAFRSVPLLDAYDVYQHLMNYWAETMQDDCYLIAADGWVAVPARIVETDKKGKKKDKGWSCDLVPRTLIVARYFAKDQAALDAKQAELEATDASLAALEEEHGGEDGFLGALDKIAKAEVNARLKEIRGDMDANEERAVLEQWLQLNEQAASLKRAVKEQDAALDALPSPCAAAHAAARPHAPCRAHPLPRARRARASSARTPRCPSWRPAPPTPTHRRLPRATGPHASAIASPSPRSGPTTPRAPSPSARESARSARARRLLRDAQRRRAEGSVVSCLGR